MLTRRAKKRLTPTATIRRWTSQEASYALDEVASLYGPPRAYLVIRKLPGGQECVLGRHRKRVAAVKVLERICR